jgi:hypothetical protein
MSCATQNLRDWMRDNHLLDADQRHAVPPLIQSAIGFEVTANARSRRRIEKR